MEQGVARILIIEDCEDDAFLVARHLEHSGLQFVWQRVDTEAAMVAALDTQDWDVVICDYSLPRFNGLAALRIIKQRSEDVPFILVSGTVGEEAAVEALKAGANDYVLKDRLTRLGQAVLREIRESHFRKQSRLEIERAQQELESRVAQRTAELAEANAQLRDEVAARRRVEQSLRASESEYRTGFEISAVGKAQTDAVTGRFLRVNSKLCEITGYSAEELLGLTHTQITYPDDAALHDDELVRMLAGTSSEYDVEKRYVRKDGQLVWVHVTAVVIRGSDDGRPQQCYAVVEDITRRKADEEELKRTTERLRQAHAVAEAATRAKSEFLANMSHEIRTPMTAIVGYAEMLLEPVQSPAQQRHRINVIRRNAEHLLALINGILDLSKIEAGEMTVERIRCSPAQILNDVSSTMRVRASDKKLAFQVEADGEIPESIQSDPTRLKQILLNLVGNAVKFTESGSVRLTARLERDDHATPRLRFEVTDTGIGMDQAAMTRLFQPFTQLDPSVTRRFGGTGLGLAITRKLVTLLGGDVAVRSTIGIGTVFSVQVPTGDLQGVPMRGGTVESMCAHQETPAPIHATRLTGRLLLAEDSPDNQQMLGHYLRQAGADVVVVGNGLAAVETAIAAAQPFDLIFMDMQMPVLDGYSAASQLRQVGYGGPIIALTAHALSEDRAKCLAAGCTDHLPKPLTRQLLLDTAARYLAARNAAGTATSTAETAGSARGTGEAPLRSTLDDEDIRPFLASFVERLPSQVADLTRLLAENDLHALAGAVHGLKGCGGIFGFPTITECASEADAEIERGAPLDVIRARVETLVRVLRGVEGFSDGKSENAATPVIDRRGGGGSAGNQTL